MKKRVAIFFVVAHLAFTLFAFYRDSFIFNNDSYCNFHNGDLMSPTSLLLFTDVYFFVPAEISRTLENFLKSDGTGGPCTYISINPSLPYSLVFILISSLVYYFIGLLIGILLEKEIKIRKETKNNNV